MTSPELLPFNPPALSEQLRRRTNRLRSKIVRANCNTQFAHTAPELIKFRYATTGLLDGMDDDAISESFRRSVHLTTYGSYAPLIERFSEKPCKASTLVDMLAPGLPDYLGLSSSTSGGVLKTFPRYNCVPEIGCSDSGSQITPRRTRAWMSYLRYKQIDVVGEDNDFVKTIYMTCVSTIPLRKKMYLHPDEDEERMGKFLLDHAAPFAAGLITIYRSFLFIHALFAISSKSLETMDMLFINMVVDMMQLIDMEFDVMVDCIASGTIPDMDGIDMVRRYLEVNLFPDPKRAEELRCIGRPGSQPGWCARVWPKLCSVIAIASGSFALSLPLVRWFLGPDTNIVSHGYGSTEAWIGPPYSPLELNQFRLSDTTVFEFLDITMSDSISSLAQPWEIGQGKRYELVLTTQDGLWRYRLGDVVEISGFDPVNGNPVVQFVERRNVVIRFHDIMIRARELEAAMSSMLTNVASWTTTVDDRSIPDTIGFFVELAGDQPEDSELALAPERALEELSRLNGAVEIALSDGLFRKPTVRLVRPGTFRDFLQLKLDEGSDNLGQIKVPVVLPKAEYVKWFLGRVTQEL